MGTPALGRHGAYLIAQQYHSAFPAGRVAVLEDLGFSTVWIAGNAPGDLEIPESVLAHTRTAAVGTAIVNVWTEPVEKVAESFHRVEQKYPGRLVLGIGAAHRETIGADYRKPFGMLSDYLEQLRQHGVPGDRILLAALRTKTLRLSADRAAGSLPYFTTVAHTKKAREILGDGPTLAVVQSFVPGTDRDVNRALLREWTTTYLNFTNYVNNLRETGFPDLELGAEPSDELLDALAPLGGGDEVAARVEQHLQEGADHVPVYPVDGSDDPVPAFERIAALLRGDEAVR